MKVGLAGPIGSEDISHLTGVEAASQPLGYRGAPLMASLAAELLRKGHEVVAFTTSSDISKPVVVRSTSHNFSIHYAPARPHGYISRNGKWGKAIDAFRQERYWLQKKIVEARVDIVHAHWSYEFSLAALDSNAPCLVTCHDAPQVVLRYMPNLYRLVRYMMARKVLRRSRFTTAVSPYLKEMIQHYTDYEITVVPNPLPDYGVPLSITGHSGAAPRIAMVLNGWNPLKNPQPAMKAFKVIRGTLPTATLHLYGLEYESGGRAEQWARSQNLAEGVFFHGKVPHAEMLAQISRYDVVIHPSLEETFGMAIAEAMAMGVPVVGGIRSGAVPWVIGDGGVVVDVQDHAAIAEAVLSLLQDPERLRVMRQVARESTINRFSVQSVASHYERLYRNVIREGRTC